MPRVGFIIYKLGVGGAERMIINLANKLSKSGYTIDFVLGNSGGGFEDKIKDSVNVFKLNSMPIPGYRSLGMFPGLRSYIQEKRPTTLISAMTQTNAVTVLSVAFSDTTVKCISTVHNTFSEIKRPLHKPHSLGLHLLGEFAYSMSDEVVCCSHGVENDLRQQLHTRLSNCGTIYNPIFTEELVRQSREEVEDNWFIDEKTIVITGLSNLKPQKDYETFLKSFEKIRSNIDDEVKAKIMGDGKERQKLIELSKSLGHSGDIEFSGYVENPFKYIRASDCFVLTSKFEGLSNVLIEAMACETPIVSSDCPNGPREILDNGKFGKLVPVGKPDPVADAVVETVQSQSTPDFMGRAKDFSLESICSKYEKLIV